MPAFCAAFGSFHPKSSVTYFVRVLTTVRVLPLFLTFTLICSSTLMVSTFGVRSYSDQRYWSMQTSGSGHTSRASELTAGLATFCTGSVGLIAANSTGGRGIRGGSDKAALPLPLSATSTEPAASLASFRFGSGVLNDAIATGTAAGFGIGGGSDKAAPPLAISATDKPCSPSAVTRGASTCSARAVADVTSIGAPVLSMPSEPRPASPAPTQPARTTVPHNAANTASRLFTPHPSQVSPRNGRFQISVDDDCKPNGHDESRGADNPRKLSAHNRDVARDEPPNLQQTA